MVVNFDMSATEAGKERALTLFANLAVPSRYKIALCFRFQRLPGFCQVQLFMLDFSLPFSQQCVGDHLLIGGQWRYCGDSLQSTGSK
jgi:hypothetical protein